MVLLFLAVSLSESLYLRNCRLLSTSGAYSLATKGCGEGVLTLSIVHPRHMYSDCVGRLTADILPNRSRPGTVTMGLASVSSETRNSFLASKASDYNRTMARTCFSYYQLTRLPWPDGPSSSPPTSDRRQIWNIIDSTGIP